MTLTDVVVAALRAAGIRTGDGIAKDTTGDLAVPYTVVYPFSGVYDGPVSAPSADAAPVLQVTSVGLTRGSAEHTALLAGAVMLGPLAAPAGFVYAGVAVRELSQGIRRDDDPVPPLFFAVDHYRFSLTPA